MRPLRILHVVGSMKRGGIETWLMSVLRHLDRQEFLFDFLVSASAPSPWEPEIRAAGGRIIVCMAHSQPLRYGRNFLRALRRHGPYDVVHSHLHHLGGWVMWLASRAGVRGRVAHSHFDTSGLEEGALRRLRYRLAGKLIGRYATGGLAVSARAADALYGPGWRRDPRFGLFPLGFEPFRDPVDRAAVRAELGIPREVRVIGHASRFVAQKNPAFLVEIARAAADPKARFLLVGDGPLRRETEEHARAAGLAGRFHFTGLRPDAPRLMAGAMDVFVLPSFYEGLPFVLLEAQSAGLPCVISANIAEESDVIPALIRRLPLSAGARAWADAALAARGISRDRALAAMERSPFYIRNSVRLLEDYYRAAAQASACALPAGLKQ